MIQRIQTLFLLEIAFLSISLLFIPVEFLYDKINAESIVQLLPLSGDVFRSSEAHYAAIVINFLNIVLCFITIFSFKKRELQVKLCYVLILFYLVLSIVVVFVPLIQPSENITDSKINILSCIIFGVCIISAFIAARFIKKDIELLRSTDRIR